MNKSISKSILAGAFLLLLAQFSAVSASSFYFNPSAQSIPKQCTRRVDIMINTQGEDSNAADIEINYNPAQLEIVDSNANQSGIQLEPGDAYETYFGNIVDNATGVAKLAGGSFIDNFDGVGRFATVQFRSKGATASANFTIKFNSVGDTLDSNIARASDSLDTLNSVTNANLTFNNNPCVADTTGPTITFNSPTNGQVNVGSGANVVFTVADAGVGVDINTVVLTINGVPYTVNTPGVTYTGTPASYTITVPGSVHGNSILTDVTNILRVDAIDNAGNASSRTISVNAPPVADTVPPVVEFVQPVDEFDNFDQNQPIIFNVSDAGSGVNIGSIQVMINDKIFTIADSNFTYTGSPSSYTITISNYAGAIQNKKVNKLIIRAYDFAGNLRETALGVGVCIDNDEGPTFTSGGANPGQICLGPTVNIPSSGIVKDFLESAGTPGTFAALSLIGLAITLLPWLNSLNLPALLINLIGAIVRKRTANAWGSIYDKRTAKPLALSTIRIYSAGTTNVIAQAVSDMDGKYRIVVAQGSYRIEVMHPGYRPYSREFTVREAGGVLAMNIPMLDVSTVNKTQASIWKYRIRKYLGDLATVMRPALLFFGFAFSTVALIISPNLLNLVIVIIYFIIFAIYIIAYINSQRFGVVLDSETGYRIPAAVVKIYDAKKLEVVDNQVTNALGQFDFYGDPGEYLLLVAAWGYNFPSNSQHNVNIVEKGIARFIKVRLQKGRNRIQILLDPKDQTELEGGTAKSNGGTLANPFG